SRAIRYDAPPLRRHWRSSPTPAGLATAPPHPLPPPPRGRGCPKDGTCGSRGSVLDCASPLALSVGSPPLPKRQKTGALQNLAGPPTVHGEEPYFAANFEPPRQGFLDIDTTNVSVESCVQKILQASPAGDSLTRDRR